MVDSDERLNELAEKYEGFDKADGMFFTEVDGKQKIFINSKVAAAAENTNVIGHEYLHAIVSKSFSSCSLASSSALSSASFSGSFISGLSPDGGSPVTVS